jgi:asparaginyl-tRNA synthetase
LAGSMSEATCIGRVLSSSRPGDEVTVRGWIYRTRSSGSIVFAVLRDSTGIIQVTVKKGNLPDEDLEAAKSALIESSVVVNGKVAEDKRAPGGMEVRAASFKVIGTAQPFPITEYQSEELLLDNRHLWIRSREQSAVMKVKASITEGAREWLRENGFTEVTPPILTQNACEGGGVPQPERPDVPRGADILAGARLLADAVVPRREVKDHPSPHGVLAS